MKDNRDDTPPSSVNGDEITGMDEEEGVFYIDEMDELELDEIEMEEVTDLEEEDIEIDPPEDHSALVFDKHVGSVFCCDIHPDGRIAVTGGEDDKAYVWSVETGQVIMDCTGHKDSVIFVGFSFDGTYLCTADMCGLIKVWKVNLEEGTPDQPQATWSSVFEYEAEDLIWGLWHFGTRVLIFGATSGDIYVLKIPSGDTKVLQGNNTRVEYGKLFPDGTRLAAGYDDGSIRIWDLKTSAVLHTVPAGLHQLRVIAIDTHPDNNLMISISSDDKAVLTTSSNGKVIGNFAAEDDVELVAFSPDPQLGLFALGTLKGSVSIWDAARQMLRHNCAKSGADGVEGVTRMIWINNHLVTGCLDGSIRVYEGRSGEKSLTLTGNRSEVLDLCYNAQKNVILTTSDDGTARIFKYEVNKEKD